MIKKTYDYIIIIIIIVINLGLVVFCNKFDCCSGTTR